MATTKNKNDPIEEALDIGYGLGREDERCRQAPKLTAARRGGARRGRAQGRSEITQQWRESSEAFNKRMAAWRVARDRSDEERLAAARRGAYQSGAARARRDAETQARARSAPRRAAQSPYTAGARELNAPNFNASPVSGGLDRKSGARIIVIITAISGVLAVAGAALGQQPGKVQTQVGNQVVKVPAHLRSIGGVLVAGTISLLVNEINPGIGVALAILLGVDVGYNTLTGQAGLYNRISSGLFQGVTPAGTQPILQATPGSSAPGLLPVGKGFRAWVQPPAAKAPGLVPIGPYGVATPAPRWDGHQWVYDSGARPPAQQAKKSSGGGLSITDIANSVFSIFP